MYAHNVGKMLSADSTDGTDSINSNEHFYVVTEKGALAKRLTDEQQGFFSLTPAFKFLPVLSALRLARWVTQFKIDIIHIHWNRDLKLAAMAKLFCKRDFKLVYSRHMQITRSKKDFFHKLLYNRVDCMITHTKLSRREAIQFLPLPENKIHLSYLGTAVPPPSSESECVDFFRDTAFAGDKTTFKIGLLGRIEHGKGQHILVDAIKLLKSQDVNFAVGLIGHVMDEAYFTQLKQNINSLGLDEQLHYFGFIDNPVRFVNCFDVIVLTTYAETFGLVVIEAMHEGVAVVATNAGGVPEIISHDKDGLLFEPGNAQELAGALTRLYKDPEFRQQLALAGQATAKNRFSEQGHFTELKQILMDVVGS